MRPPYERKTMPKKSPPVKTGLEKTIDKLIADMDDIDSASEDYANMVSQLDTLYKLKAEDKPDRVSRDTLAIVAGNLLGIVLIVGYERANLVTSKALALLAKTR
jgi:hypothetical protein